MVAGQSGLNKLITFLYLIIAGIINALIPNKYKTKKDVRGKLILITGAGQGMGLLFAEKFAALGANLILWDISEGNLKKAVEKCKQFKGTVSYQVVDVSEKEKVYAATDKIKKDYGCIDILINNAGILYGKEFLELEEEAIEKLMKVNTFSNWWLIKAFLPEMIEQRSGHIVSLCSLAGFVGAPWLIDYSVSKFGVMALMEGLRNELTMKGNTDIKTTIVVPNFVQTRMVDDLKICKGRPILEPEFVVDRAIEAILLDQTIIMIPRTLYALFYLKGILPTAAWDYFVSLHLS
uniref:Epidermal retinol dehydrogenase 2 n=1 Tax=Rhabditophanes sp. KR3021 TaxID=114890 RepID=A0AC35TUL2_9BILA